MKIHIISTVNGQANEGMRNVATYIAKAFEADHEVCNSGLNSIPSIIKNSRACDVTMIFARANKLIYWLARMVGMFSKNFWIVCVQKPNAEFTTLVNKHPLKASYLTIVEKDLDEIVIRKGYRKARFDVGINVGKFSPVSTDRQRELKEKYQFNPNRPLVIHVGHCSAGRGLEDFTGIADAERLIVASGMFENADTVKVLRNGGVRIHKGYLEHVEEIYQMADVYLFPTHSTEFVISIPLSVMEALSCGVPVIGYQDFANMTEITAEDRAIMLVGSINELNGAVTKLAQNKRNVSFLKNPKTWEQVAEQVLDIVKIGSTVRRLNMKPAMISFMGLDGSGKSTSIDYAYEQLKKRGYKVKIIRAAYVIVVLRGIIKLGKKILMKKESDPYGGDYGAYLESMRKQAKKGSVYSIFSFLTTIEFKLQLFFRVRVKRFFGTTLLVDRYIYDNIVTYAANLDLGEDYMEMTMNGKWKRAPRPDRIIYIKTPVEVCCSRKNDIPDPLYLAIRKPLYEKVADMYGATVIEGDQDKQKMLDEVMKAVDEVLPSLKKKKTMYCRYNGERAET